MGTTREVVAVRFVGWDEDVLVRWDGAQASAPVEMQGDDGEWMALPIQTADAQHRVERLVERVADHMAEEVASFRRVEG